MKNKDERRVNIERRQGTDLVSGFVIPLLTPCCSSDKQRNRHFLFEPQTYEGHPPAHAPIHLCCVRNYDTEKLENGKQKGKNLGLSGL